MESIVKFLEKGQPYFDKVSKNIYLQPLKTAFGSNAHHPVFFCLPAYFDLPGVVATVAALRCPTGGTSTS